MKIVVDRDIPYIEGVLEPFAEVVYLPGGAISAADVRDADAILTRTRTRCDASLLQGSRVRFIATATIGFDHIDRAWCAANDVTVCTSAGCNVRGVLQWVAATLARLDKNYDFHENNLSSGQSSGKARDAIDQGAYTDVRDRAERERNAASGSPSRQTLGVVGVGNVGKLVAEYAADWGFRVMRSDPPREKTEHLTEKQGFFSLDEIAAQADIITFHVPLDASTRHLVDAEFLRKTNRGAVILNSSRGAVIDPEALRRTDRRFVIDTWNDEPAIDRQILERALLATPHIAGYSAQGKANATAMAVNQLARHFDLPIEPLELQSAARKISWDEMREKMPHYFDIAAQSRALKQNPQDFEVLRNNYKYRTEFF